MKRKFTILMLVMVLLIPSVLFADIDTLWTKTYDVDNGVGYSLVEVADGGYLIVGYHDYVSGPYVIRTDINGDTIWTRNYEFFGEADGVDVISVSDGNYVITGYKIYANDDIILMKIDDMSDTIWTRIYDFGGEDLAHAVCQARDGGYIIAGQTTSFDAIGFDVFLVKTDSIGEVQGTYLYKSDGMYEAAYGVDTTSDGGYIVACQSDSASLLRFDSEGNLLWKLNGSNTSFYAVKTLVGGDFVALGTSSGSLKISLVNDNGYAYNSRNYGPSGYCTIGYALDVTSDGGYILGGLVTDNVLNDRVYIVRVNENLSLLWKRIYGSQDDWDESGVLSIKETSDGDYIAVGYKHENGDDNIWLLKLGEVQDIVSGDSTNIPNNYLTLTSYPNPFNSATEIKYYLPANENIKLGIYNLLGRKIKTLYNGTQAAGYHKINWNAKYLPSGIYFCRLFTGDESKVIRMILLK